MSELGNAPLEQNLGYVRQKDDKPEAEPLTVAEAAAKMRDVEPPPLDPAAVDLTPLAPNAAISVEQAADRLKAEQKIESEFEKEAIRLDVADAVDSLRRLNGALPDEPAPAAEEAKPEPAADAKPEPKSEPKSRPAPVTQEAREEIERVQSVYADELVGAHKLAAIAAFSPFPETAGQPVENIPGIMQALAIQQPQRYAQIVGQVHGAMQTVAELHERELAAKQEIQKRKQEKFVAWAQSEDDKFTAKFKDFGDKEKAASMRQGVVRYLTETVGIEKDLLPKLWHNPFFRDSRMQQIVWDAASMHMARERTRGASKADAHPVQRPGVSNVRNRSDNSEQIERLQSQLKGAKGLEAVRISARLLTLSRTGAR